MSVADGWNGVAGGEALWPVTAVLVAGALAGEFVARWTRLPRVVGYTATGCIAAALGFGTPMPLGGAARLVVDVALGLLLFEIGSRVNLRWLRANPGLLATSLAESLLGALAVAGALLALDVDGATAAACAVLSIPASAAVAGRVALELGAEGQVTHRLKLLTALNTLYAVLAMTVLRLWWAAGREPDVVSALSALANSFFASLLAAALLTAAVLLLARRIDLRHENAALLLFGLLVLAIAGARAGQLSTLLVPLLAGVMLRHASPRPWLWPRHFGTAGGVLVLVLFVVAGSCWTTATLVAGGAAALAMVAARGLGKGAAVLALAGPAHASPRQAVALSIALTPISATTLVLLSDLMRGAPELSLGAVPIVLTAVALLELAGVVAVQAALHLAGELDAAAARTPR